MSTVQPTMEQLDEAEQYHEPADYDSWYSALVSFVFHFCLVMILPLLATVFAAQDTLPPAVQVVQVAEATSSAGEAADDLPSGEDSPEISTDEPTASEFTEPVPTETISEIDPVEVPIEELTTDDVQANVRDALAKAKAAAAAAKAAAASALNENINNAPGGGGGGGGAGRAGRAARWILRFNTSSPRSYLTQMGGLGAEIAFPLRGDQYKYFSNLGAANPASSVRDLAGETRIYWIDENVNSFGGVARELGVGSPPMMIAFLPVELEQKMLKIELAFKGASSEDQILQTIFECVARGGGYDVIVVDQRLRNE